jgi:hypothetical protein
LANNIGVKLCGGCPLCNLFPKIPEKSNMYATKFPHAKINYKNPIKLFFKIEPLFDFY